MEFVNFDQQPTQARGSEAIALNGIWLDDTIAGYSTLTVSGRETIMQLLRTTADIPGRHGEMYHSAQLPSRLLTVKYRLQASNSRKMLERFDMLKAALLQSDELSLQVNDDKEHIWYVYFEGMSDLEPGQLSVAGELYFKALDPYRYEVKSSFVDISSSGTIEKTGGYEIALSDITVTTQEAAQLTILNQRTGKRIILKGPFAPSDTVTLEFGHRPSIRNTHESILHRLVFAESNFPDFEIKSEDTLTIEGGSMRVSYKGRKL